MYVKLGATIRGVFGTNAFADGSATNADSTPTIVILDQGTAMGYAPTIVNKATGLYEVPMVLSSGNGFTVGHEYTCYAVVVLGGKTTRTPIEGVSSFNVTARDPDDLAYPATSGRSLAVDTSGVVDANVTKNLGTAAPSPTVAGIPKVEDATVRTTVTDIQTDVDELQTSVAAISASAIRDAVLDAARSGHVTLGTIGEGIALAASLLQGNFFIDNVTNTANGPTAQRLRCWTSAAGMSGATAGGSGQGEFATFNVTTAYAGVNQISSHKVVQQ